MSMALKEKMNKNFKKRDISPKSIIQIINNALSGLGFYAKDGKSIIIYVVCFIVEVVSGFIFNIDGKEWILIICILGVILSVELINTAIESVCDLITKEYNPLVKMAKDCACAATFSIFIVAVILNIIIFYPKVVGLF